MNTKLSYLAAIAFFLITATSVIAQSPVDGMVFIPEGEFVMGKNADTDRNYSPEHEVVISAFYIDVYEVTNGQYAEFCKATDHRLPEFWDTDVFKSGDGFANYPVVGVSYSDAAAYAKWKGKRLPTEAEWEYAARGGLKGKSFPNGNKWTKPLKKRKPGAWENQIEEVGLHEANGYGLYNMSGNVWEWTSDNYDSNYYKNSPKVNPQGPEKGNGKTIRGGSWHSGAMCKRIYFRKGLSGGWCDFAVGFRCAKSIDE